MILVLELSVDILGSLDDWSISWDQLTLINELSTKLLGASWPKQPQIHFGPWPDPAKEAIDHLYSYKIDNNHWGSSKVCFLFLLLSTARQTAFEMISPWLTLLEVHRIDHSGPISIWGIFPCERRQSSYNRRYEHVRSLISWQRVWMWGPQR